MQSRPLGTCDLRRSWGVLASLGGLSRYVSGLPGPRSAASLTGPARPLASSLAAAAAAGYWHPALGAALAAADVPLPAVIAFILLTAILRGSAGAGLPAAPSRPPRPAAGLAVDTTPDPG